MIIKNILKVFGLIASFSIIMLLITCGGCGGGGGSSSSSEGSTSGAYTGLTSQATVTQTNAHDLMLGAYMGGAFGSQLSILQSNAVQVNPCKDALHSLTLIISQSLKDVLKKVNLPSKSMFPTTASALSLPPTQTVQGDCGGQATESDTVNDQTGAVTGSVVFDSFCIMGATISGTVTYSGNINENTGEILLNATYSNCSITTTCVSATASGNVQIDVTDTGFTGTYTNFYIHDNNLKKTDWISNFVITVSDEGSYTNMTMNGRYYHPDYGYIDVTTQTPFVIYSGDDFPSQGLFIATGTGNTKAKLTAISSSAYQIEVDTNADGTYEWNSGSLSWQSGCTGTSGGVSITGTWEAAATSAANFGGASGVLDMLLTQTGTIVTGTIIGIPIANGAFINGVLTGSFSGENGRTFDILATPSNDTTLNTTVTQHYKGTDSTFQLTFNRLSNTPQNPDPTPPAVNSTSPSRNQTNVARSNLAVAITWSKPVNGWDLTLTGNIGGVQRTIEGNNLIDKSQNTYDPVTHTYTMHLLPSIVLDPVTTYTMILDSGSSVDWHDPFGVPAWANVTSAYQITFTTGN